jgi:peptidoglycan hydrolase CwlO-like protein
MIKKYHIILLSLVLVGAFGVLSISSAFSNNDLNVIKAKLADLNRQKDICTTYNGEKKIECLGKVMTQINSLLIQVKGYESEVGSKTAQLQNDVQNLKNQIGYIDAQKDNTKIQVQITQQEMSLAQIRIAKTEEEIKEMKRKMQYSRNKLASGLKSFYEYDKENFITMIFTDGSISKFFDEIIYAEKIQAGVTKGLEGLKEDKALLDRKKKNLQAEKQDLGFKKEAFNRQIVEMNQLQQQKSELLEVTEGSQEKYETMLATIKNATSHISANLSQISAEKQAEITEYLQKNPINTGVCKKALAVPYFAQTNTLWAGKYIGASNYKVGGWGCALTSVAMVLNYYGKSTNPGIIADTDKFFEPDGDIYWWAPANAYGIHFNGTGGSIDGELAAGRPVIVWTNYEHYVVIIGKDTKDYIVLDPLQRPEWGIPGGCLYLSQSYSYASRKGRGTITQVIRYSK